MASVASNHTARDMGESYSRITKDGRKLTYELAVIQQPERARACGSGAKSSADRRPVDPPPVVELRIYEGEARNDITFSYNANLFLFATLELSRPIAPGRGQPSTPQIPVLTGMPVSGMAYLDRPVEAGYFIFPDLSVRHEGKYRLSFNLYEETKEAKDMDATESEPKREGPAGAMGLDSAFYHRLEVKSAPFTVYSAKKFPGLAESTSLSRTVAEQGCRVRIRRDVRMRRRDGKGSGEFDDFEENDFSRARRTATPESHQDRFARQRSLSNSSMDRRSFIADAQRRPSGPEYPPAPSYQAQYAQSPITPQSHSNSYLTFGGGAAAPQYSTPQYAPPAPPPQAMAAPQPYQQPAAPYASSQYRAGSFSYGDRQPYQGYPPAAPAPRDSYEHDYRRASTGYSAPPPPLAPQYPPDNTYGRSQAAPSYQNFPPRAQTPAMSGVALAPLRMPMDRKYDSLSSPKAPSSASRMAPLSAPLYDGVQSRNQSYSHFSAPTSANVDVTRAGKRSFDSVFPSSSTYSHQPLHNGMRPSDIQQSAHGFDDEDDGPTMEELKMQYKRADGSAQERPLPSLE